MPKNENKETIEIINIHNLYFVERHFFSQTEGKESDQSSAMITIVRRRIYIINSGIINLFQVVC